MSKLDDILKIISEDSIDAPSTSVAPGNELQFSSPPTNSEFTTLADLLQYKTGMSTGETTNKVLGVPLQNILAEMTTAYFNILEIRRKFKEASKNPVYKDKGLVFDRVETYIKTLQTQFKALTRELDNLSLD